MKCKWRRSGFELGLPRPLSTMITVMLYLLYHKSLLIIPFLVTVLSFKQFPKKFLG